jgi:L-amino acid N-acyltransferase YncA
MSRLTIRPAVLEDARDIAQIHVRGWQWAYRGQVPDEILDGLSVERRMEGWERELAGVGVGSPSRVWVAERDGQVIGFASSGVSRDQDAAQGTAEIYAVYLLPEVAGTGVGRAIFAHAVDELRRQGFTAATLWVLETNERTRRFYEAAGWTPDGAAKTDELRGAELREVRYRIDLGGPTTTGSRPASSGRPALY